MERELEKQAEEQLEKDAIAEIDRYRRMDEWSSSYQNIYSRTALCCHLRFVKAKMLDLDIMHFLQYTRAGTFDMLRLEAFECLVELDMFRSPELIRWFIYTMSADPSPWLRLQLHRLFGRALAPVAFGDGQRSDPPPQHDGLIIEQESTTQVRQEDLARRQTVTGAIDGLKKELSANPTLKESLWAACNSPCIGVLEMSDFLDLCKVLYDPVYSVMVRLKYPRYWKVEHLGKVSSILLDHIIYLLFRQLTSFHRDKCVSTDRTASERPSHPQRTPSPRSANARRKACVHPPPESHSSSPSSTTRLHLPTRNRRCGHYQNCICPTSTHPRLSRRRPCRPVAAAAHQGHHRLPQAVG